jgi:hypothetical protein
VLIISIFHKQLRFIWSTVGTPSVMECNVQLCTWVRLFFNETEIFDVTEIFYVIEFFTWLRSFTWSRSFLWLKSFTWLSFLRNWDLFCDWDLLRDWVFFTWLKSLTWLSSYTWLRSITWLRCFIIISDKIQIHHFMIFPIIMLFFRHLVKWTHIKYKVKDYGQRWAVLRPSFTKRAWLIHFEVFWKTHVKMTKYHF